MRGLIGDFRLHQEAIAFSRNGFDVERFIGRIAERLAEFVNGRIYVSVVIDMRIGGPEPEAQLFTCNDFTRFFEERHQDLIDLPLELEPGAVSSHFLPLLVNPERPKMDIAARR